MNNIIPVQNHHHHQQQQQSDRRHCSNCDRDTETSAGMKATASASDLISPEASGVDIFVRR